jgi:predicted DNA-binding transcriptional regulator AlpA
MNLTDNSSHTTAADQLISRQNLAHRWGCSQATLKRWERAGTLQPVRFNCRLLRYRLSDIIALEHAAATNPASTTNTLA